MTDREELPATPDLRTSTEREADGQAALSRQGAVLHAYISTACWHAGDPGRFALHERCRKVCKFCDAACSCPCHGMSPSSIVRWRDAEGNPDWDAAAQEDMDMTTPPVVEVVDFEANAFEFDGACTDQNPDICECGKDYTPTCAACDEPIEGESFRGLTTLLTPWLADDDFNNEYETAYWHRRCDQGVVGEPPSRLIRYMGCDRIGPVREIAERISNCNPWDYGDYTENVQEIANDILEALDG